MSDRMTDQEMAEIFRGVKITFSKHCKSGIVGRDKCPCWRCKRERGEPPTACVACRQPIIPGEESADFHDYHNEREQCVAATARRCAEMLETEGVMLDIVPGETKYAHVARFARAFAAKMRTEFNLEQPKAKGRPKR